MEATSPMFERDSVLARQECQVPTIVSILELPGHDSSCQAGGRDSLLAARNKPTVNPSCPVLHNSSLTGYLEGPPLRSSIPSSSDDIAVKCLFRSGGGWLGTCGLVRGTRTAFLKPKQPTPPKPIQTIILSSLGGLSVCGNGRLNEGNNGM